MDTTFNRSLLLLAPLPNNCLAMFLANRMSKMYLRNDVDLYLPFLFTYPKLMECPQACKDAATQPAPIPTLSGVSWCMYFQLYEKQLLFMLFSIKLRHSRARRFLTVHCSNVHQNRRINYRRQLVRHYPAGLDVGQGHRRSVIH